MTEAKAALVSSAAVSVGREIWIGFSPRGESVASGLILYPGGRVPPEAYAPLALAVAEDGFLAVIVPMPLNLAVFVIGAPSAGIDAYPKIATWVIGGHSLGGAMAARYAHENSNIVDGLLLIAAYAEALIDFSDGNMTVATVYGHRDGLATIAEVQASFEQLPADALRVLVKGGNHAQFGWYEEQAGDQTAGISRAEQ